MGTFKSIVEIKTTVKKIVISKAISVFWGLLTNASQIILVKIVSWNFGPSGILSFNNLRQLTQIFSAFFTMYSENLVTIQIKKSGFRIDSIYSIVQSYKKILFIGLLPVLIFLFLNHSYKPVVLNNPTNRILFLLSSLIFALNLILFSIFNGINGLSTAYKNQIIGFVASSIFLVLIKRDNIETNELVIYLLLISSSITLFLNIGALYSVYTANKLLELESKYILKSETFFSVFSVGVMFSTYLIGNVLQFILRKRFVDYYSVNTAGLIESAFTLSNYFATIVISIFTMNSLGDISIIRTNGTLKKVTGKILIYGFFLLLIIAIIIYIFRIEILKLFYTDKFIGIERFYGLLVFGDIFKILTGVLMVLTYTRGKMGKYFIMAMLFNLTTLIPLFAFKFSDTSDLGVFYILSNILNFLLTLIFYFSDNRVFDRNDFFNFTLNRNN